MKNINITFSEPLYLLIIIPLVILTLIPYLRLASVRKKKVKYFVPLILRIFVIIIIALLLAGISNEKTEEKVTTLILADYSSSTDTVRENMESYISDMMDYSDDKNEIGLIVFADNSLYEIKAKNNSKFSKNIDKPVASATNIQEAIEFTKDIIKEEQNARIIILSDGYETEGDALLAAKDIAGSNIKVDAVVFDSNDDKTGEIQVSKLESPSSVVAGEDYTVDICIKSSVKTDAVIKLYDNDKLMLEKEVSINADDNIFTEKLNADITGVHILKLEIESKDDKVKENNKMYSYVKAVGEGKILIVDGTGEEHDKLETLISATSEVDAVNVSDVPKTLDALLKYDEVILMNVNNSDLPAGYDKIIEEYVHDKGKSLFTTGGENTYHYGNMEGTAFEEILPVDININDKKDSKKAIILLLDTSRSMDLNGFFDTAKEAAIATVNSLSEEDYIGVISFSGQMKIISGLTTMDNKDTIIQGINELETVPKTYLYEPIYNAYMEFEQSDADIKHCIILSDGNPSDSGHAGLIQDMYASGITTSTILIGNDATTDIMQTLADLGGGEFYKVDDIESNLADTMIKEAEVTSYTAKGNFEITVNDYIRALSGVEELPNVSGYICTKIKEKAKNVLYHKENNMPIYAEWKYGTGKVAAITCDLNGNWSDRIYSSTSGKNFITNVIENLLTVNKTSNKLAVNTTNNGYETTVEMKVLDESTDKSIKIEVVSPTDKTSKASVEDLGKGNYISTIDTKEEGLYTLNVEMYNKDGSLYESVETNVTSSYSKEYDKFITTDGDKLMQDIVSLTGGEVYNNIEKLMESEIEKLKISESLFVPLGIIVLILLSLDLIIRNISETVWKNLENLTKRRD